MRSSSFIRKMNLQNKLMVIFSIAFVVPFIVFGFLSYLNIQNTLQKKTLISNSDIIKHMQISIDVYFEDIEKIAENIIKDKSFNSGIGKQEEDYKDKIKYITSNEELFGKLSNILIQKKEVMSVYLYTRSNISYFVNFEDTIDQKYTPKNEQWFIQAIEEGEGPTILAPFIDLQTNRKSLKVIPVIYPIKGFSKAGGVQSSNIGIMQLNVNFNILRDFCSINDNEEKDIYVVDKYGDTIYSNKGDAVKTHIKDTIWNTVQQNGEGNFVVNTNGNQNGISYKTSEYTGWTIIMVANNHQLIKDMTYIKMYTIIFIIVILFLFLFLSIFISRSISRPIKLLEDIVTQIETKQFEVPLQIEKKEHIGLLSDHFNKLVDAINNMLMKINYHHQKEKEQEYKILEAQINPHFIYNSLNAIRWMATMQHANEIANLIISLINLLKSSIKLGQTFISIEEEINQIRDYISLQQLRYYDSFTVEFHMDEEVKSYKTIKFVLQPIVENAIFHGLDHEKMNGKIEISIAKFDDFIEYCVKDNGKGMDKDTQKKLLDKCVKEKGFNGIGINNVNERIKNYFGTDYGINIQSEIGEGTSVSIIIPCILYEGEELNDKGIDR